MAVKEIVATKSAPSAIGPYSQGVKAGGFLFVSGQVALDPATGELVAGSIEEQTRQVMENLKAILEAAGVGMGRVVKTTIYLANLEHFAAVNTVYGSYFASEPPARATVEVSRLPRGAGVEIEAVALL